MSFLGSKAIEFLKLVVDSSKLVWQYFDSISVDIKLLELDYKLVR
jgi:hypothetical protein